MAVTAQVLGRSTKDVALDAAVFEVEVKPHLLHETVRAELNAAPAPGRAARRAAASSPAAAPSRGARRAPAAPAQGTIRAPQFTGGGVAFPPGMRSFDVKVNRKARRQALRGALSHHAANGTLALLDGGRLRGAVDEAGRRAPRRTGASTTPVLVVAHEDEEAVVKSFRNLERVLVTVPAELEVAPLVWARAVLVTQAALPLVEGRAGAGKEDGMSLHADAGR